MIVLRVGRTSPQPTMTRGLPCYSNKDESNLRGEAAAQEKSRFD